MTVEQWITFNIALIFAIASPGPAMLFAIKTSLSSGRRAGAAVGFGLGLMAALWTLAALLGLSAIFNLFPAAFLVVKYAGALYLLYIAFLMWRDARNPVTPGVDVGKRGFVQGFLINLSNPKSVLFATAVLVAIFPNGISATASLIIVINHFVIEASFYLFLSWFFTTPVIADRYLAFKHYIDRCAACILAALALRLIASR